MSFVGEVVMGAVGEAEAEWPEGQDVAKKMWCPQITQMDTDFRKGVGPTYWHVYGLSCHLAFREIGVVVFLQNSRTGVLFYVRLASSERTSKGNWIGWKLAAAEVEAKPRP